MNKFFLFFIAIFFSLNSYSLHSNIYRLDKCYFGRFSIVLNVTKKVSYFSILDYDKVIKKGVVEDEKEIINDGDLILLGNIGGVYYDDKIIIQNYGNSMNNYHHFYQCDDKYLKFNKVK